MGDQGPDMATAAGSASAANDRTSRQLDSLYESAGVSAEASENSADSAREAACSAKEAATAAKEAAAAAKEAAAAAKEAAAAAKESATDYEGLAGFTVGGTLMIAMVACFLVAVALPGGRLTPQQHK